MAEIKVSELPQALATTDNDLLMVVQNNTNKKVALQTLSYAKKQEYETVEEDTGNKWIDGKPIYRRVYYNSSYSQSASTSTPILFELPNLDVVVNVYGSAKSSTISYPLPNAMWANTTGGMQYSWNISSITSTQFYIITGSDSPLVNVKIYLVIEYTKTTD